MWVTEDGVMHTVALPDPTTAMTETFVDSLDSLGPDARISLLDALEGEQENLSDQTFTGVVPSAPTNPDDDAIPVGYLDGHFSSPSHVMSYLKGLDPQWRLDAYLAVEEYLWVEEEPTGFLAKLRELLRSL